MRRDLAKVYTEEPLPLLNTGPVIGFLEGIVYPSVVSSEIVPEIAVLVLVPVLLANPLTTEGWVPEPWYTRGSLQKRVHPVGNRSQSVWTILEPLPSLVVMNAVAYKSGEYHRGHIEAPLVVSHILQQPCYRHQVAIGYIRLPLEPLPVAGTIRRLK